MNTKPRWIARRLVEAAGVPVDLLDELNKLHISQWTLEDQARDRTLSTVQIAQIKRDIDASNSRRHQLINKIDAAVDLRPSAEPRHFYSETVGELCDRLLIFDLKYQALADRSPVIAVCDHLAVVVDRLIADVASGRATLPPRMGVKIYNGGVAE